MSHGTALSHGNTYGYILAAAGRDGAITICHGQNASETEARFGNPVTFFTTRREARRALSRLSKSAADPSKIRILRIAPLASDTGQRAKGAGK